MGSFNATCIISGLPIERGTPVRYVALTKHAHRKDNEYACYVTGRWQLRCPPLRAQYNDYGSVEKIREGLTSRVFFESLARDCIEKGTGENEYHDHKVRVEMPIEDWLNALWEGRVFVDDRFRFHVGKDWVPPEPPEGMPSMRRIEAVLAGHTGFLVDEVSRGFIRIRHNRHDENTDALDQVMPLLQAAGYAAVITCGTGNYYSHYAEILVGPRPAPKGQHFHSIGLAKDEREESPRPVAAAMIREDVWQLLLKSTDWGSFETMLEDARKLLKAELDWKAEDAAFLARDRSTVTVAERDAHMRKAMRRISDSDYDDEDRQNLLREALREGEGVSGFSLKASLKFALGLEPSPEELDAFIVDLAETAWVQSAYAALHGQWHLSTNNGQQGYWKEHRAFLTALTSIKGRWEEEMEEEMAEEEETDDAEFV